MRQLCVHKISTEEENPVITTELYDCTTLYNLISDYASRHGYTETPAALDFALKSHEGQYRSGKKHVPYICHPMMVAVHAIVLGFGDDMTLAACLLHDVLEDCGVDRDDLPVKEETKRVVELLTRDRDHLDEEGRRIYYERISENPAAVIVKLLDRNNNISDMPTSFSRRKMESYLKETRKWILPLFNKAKEYFPDKTAQVMVLQYHIESIMEAVEAL